MGNVKVWDVATSHQVMTAAGGVPWELSDDERTLATGATASASFSDIVFPQAIKSLTGHLAVIERLAWSRDNRHLVSLDNRFEVRVWEGGIAPVPAIMRHLRSSSSL
jgi:WD40 repeat protein